MKRHLSRPVQYREPLKPEIHALAGHQRDASRRTGPKAGIVVAVHARAVDTAPKRYRARSIAHVIRENDEIYPIRGARRLVAQAHHRRQVARSTGPKAAAASRSRTGGYKCGKYDFSGGVRGKYAERYAEGTNIVILEPDVAEQFRSSEAVNEALRELLQRRRKGEATG